jgi:FkbM family methyltransferase
MTVRSALVSLAARNWPFANGTGRLIDKFGGDIPSGEHELPTNDGFRITVRGGNDLVGRHIAMSGQFDRAPIAVLLDFSQDGDRCIDIGANIGYVACVLLARINDSHVVCVEPQPTITDLLERNLARFPAERWTLLRAGLSDAETEGFLAIDSVNPGASKLVTETGANTVNVPLLPAAKVFADFDRLDIVKMDIEGHEEAVFRSAAEQLRRLQPRAMLWEDQKGLSADDGAIGRVLVDAGYAIYGIEKGLFATALRKVTPETVRGFHDFVALSTTRPLPPKARAKYGV